MYLDAYADEVKFKQDTANANNYCLARDIIAMLSASMNSKPIPKYKDLYPDTKQVVNAEYEALRIKEQLKQFAEGYNKQRAAERK